MPNTITFQRTLVNTASADEEGMLAYTGGKLVAVLVRLDGSLHDEAGQWFLEAGFGRFASVNSHCFASLDEAATWLGGQRHLRIAA